jgi:hypothetical protein
MQFESDYVVQRTAGNVNVFPRGMNCDRLWLISCMVGGWSNLLKHPSTGIDRINSEQVLSDVSDESETPVDESCLMVAALPKIPSGISTSIVGVKSPYHQSS